MAQPAQEEIPEDFFPDAPPVRDKPLTPIDVSKAALRAYKDTKSPDVDVRQGAWQALQEIIEYTDVYSKSDYRLVPWADSLTSSIGFARAEGVLKEAGLYPGVLRDEEVFTREKFGRWEVAPIGKLGLPEGKWTIGQVPDQYKDLYKRAADLKQYAFDIDQLEDVELVDGDEDDVSFKGGKLRLPKSMAKLTAFPTDRESLYRIAVASSEVKTDDDGKAYMDVWGERKYAPDWFYDPDAIEEITTAVQGGLWGQSLFSTISQRGITPFGTDSKWRLPPIQEIRRRMRRGDFDPEDEVNGWKEGIHYNVPTAYGRIPLVPNLGHDPLTNRKLLMDPVYARWVLNAMKPEAWDTIRQQGAEMAYYLGLGRITGLGARGLMGGSAAILRGASRFAGGAAKLAGASGTAAAQAVSEATIPAGTVLGRTIERAAKAVTAGAQQGPRFGISGDMRGLGEEIWMEVVRGALTGDLDLSDATVSGSQEWLGEAMLGGGSRVVRAAVAKPLRHVFNTKPYREGVRALQDRIADRLRESGAFANVDTAKRAALEYLGEDRINMAMREHFPRVIDAVAVGVGFGAYEAARLEASQEGVDWNSLSTAEKGERLAANIASPQSIGGIALFGSAQLLGAAKATADAKRPLTMAERMRADDVIEHAVDMARLGLAGSPEAVVRAVEEGLASIDENGKVIKKNGERVGQIDERTLKSPLHRSLEKAGKIEVPFGSETFDIKNGRLETLAGMLEGDRGKINGRILETALRQVPRRELEILLGRIRSAPPLLKEAHGTRQLRAIVTRELSALDTLQSNLEENLTFEDRAVLDQSRKPGADGKSYEQKIVEETHHTEPLALLRAVNRRFGTNYAFVSQIEPKVLQDYRDAYKADVKALGKERANAFDLGIRPEDVALVDYEAAGDPALRDELLEEALIVQELLDTEAKLRGYSVEPEALEASIFGDKGSINFREAGAHLERNRRLLEARATGANFRNLFVDLDLDSDHDAELLAVDPDNPLVYTGPYAAGRSVPRPGDPDFQGPREVQGPLQPVQGPQQPIQGPSPFIGPQQPIQGPWQPIGPQQPIQGPQQPPRRPKDALGPEPEPEGQSLEEAAALKQRSGTMEPDRYAFLRNRTEEATQELLEQGKLTRARRLAKRPKPAPTPPEKAQQDADLSEWGKLDRVLSRGTALSGYEDYDLAMGREAFQSDRGFLSSLSKALYDSLGREKTAREGIAMGMLSVSAVPRGTTTAGKKYRAQVRLIALLTGLPQARIEEMHRQLVTIDDTTFQRALQRLEAEFGFLPIRRNKSGVFPYEGQLRQLFGAIINGRHEDLRPGSGTSSKVKEVQEGLEQLRRPKSGYRRQQLVEMLKRSDPNMTTDVAAAELKNPEVERRVKNTLDQINEILDPLKGAVADFDTNNYKDIRQRLGDRIEAALKDRLGDEFTKEKAIAVRNRAFDIIAGRQARERIHQGARRLGTLIGEAIEDVQAKAPSEDDLREIYATRLGLLSLDITDFVSQVIQRVHFGGQPYLRADPNGDGRRIVMLTMRSIALGRPAGKKFFRDAETADGHPFFKDPEAAYVSARKQVSEYVSQAYDLARELVDSVPDTERPKATKDYDKKQITVLERIAEGTLEQDPELTQWAIDHNLARRDKKGVLMHAPGAFRSVEVRLSELGKLEEPIVRLYGMMGIGINELMAVFDSRAVSPWGKMVDHRIETKGARKWFKRYATKENRFLNIVFPLLDHLTHGFTGLLGVGSRPQQSGLIPYELGETRRAFRHAKDDISAFREHMLGELAFISDWMASKFSPSERILIGQLVVAGAAKRLAGPAELEVALRDFLGESFFKEHAKEFQGPMPLVGGEPIGRVKQGPTQARTAEAPEPALFNPERIVAMWDAVQKVVIHIDDLAEKGLEVGVFSPHQVQFMRGHYLAKIPKMDPGRLTDLKRAILDERPWRSGREAHRLEHNAASQILNSELDPTIVLPKLALEELSRIQVLGTLQGAVNYGGVKSATYVAELPSWHQDAYQKLWISEEELKQGRTNDQIVTLDDGRTSIIPGKKLSNAQIYVSSFLNGETEQGTNFETPATRERLLEDLADVYIDKASLMELQGVLERNDPSSLDQSGFTGLLAQLYDEGVQAFKRRVTIGEPGYYALQIIDSVVSNHMTGRASAFDFFKSMVTGRGTHAKAARILQHLANYVSDGRSRASMERIPKDLRQHVIIADNFVASLGQGTFHEAVINPGDVRRFTDSLFSGDRQLAAASGEMSYDSQLHAIGAKAAAWSVDATNAIESKLSALVTGGSVHARVDAMRAMAGQAQFLEVFFKYVPFLEMTQEYGATFLLIDEQESYFRSMVESAAQGTVDYGDRNPWVARHSSRANPHISKKMKNALLEAPPFKIAGGTMDRAKYEVAKRAVAMPFQFVFSLFYTSGAGTWLEALRNNPARVIATVGAVSSAFYLMGRSWAGAYFKDDDRDEAILRFREAISGHDPLMSWVMNHDDVSEFVKRHGTWSLRGMIPTSSNRIDPALQGKDVPDLMALADKGGSRMYDYMEDLWRQYKGLDQLRFIPGPPSGGRSSKINIQEFQRPLSSLPWLGFLDTTVAGRGVKDLWSQFFSENPNPRRKGFFGIGVTLAAWLDKVRADLWNTPAGKTRLDVVSEHGMKALDNMFSSIGPAAAVSGMGQRFFEQGALQGQKVEDWMKGYTSAAYLDSSEDRMKRFLAETIFGAHPVAERPVIKPELETDWTRAVVQRAAPGLSAQLTPEARTAVDRDMEVLRARLHDQIVQTIVDKYIQYQRWGAGRDGLDGLVTNALNIEGDIFDGEIVNYPQSDLGKFLKRQGIVGDLENRGPRGEEFGKRINIGVAYSVLGDQKFHDALAVVIGAARLKMVDASVLTRMLEAAWGGPTKVMDFVHRKVFDEKDYDNLPVYKKLFLDYQNPDIASKDSGNMVKQEALRLFFDGAISPYIEPTLEPSSRSGALRHLGPGIFDVAPEAVEIIRAKRGATPSELLPSVFKELQEQ